MKANGNVNIVTVFSDASYYHEERVAGWGWWWKGCGLSAHGDGASDNVASVEDAELLGIKAVITAAIAALPQELQLTFVIQCDSTSALGILLHSSNRVRVAKTSNLRIDPCRRRSAVASDIHQVLPHGRHWLKHVKGHTNGQDPRSFINRKNDSRARFAAKSLMGKEASV